MGERSHEHAWIDAVPISSLIVDEEGTIRQANHEASRLFGWPRELLVGSCVEVLVPGPLRGEHAQARQRFARTPRQRAMGRESRLQARHQDGHLFPVDVMLAPLGGGIVLCIVVDRSEVLQIESKLGASAAAFRCVMDHVQDIVYVVRHEGEMLTGRVETVSAHVRDVLGYEAQDFIDDQELWFSCVHPDDREEVERVTRRMFEQKQPVTRTYRLRHRQTGRWHLMEDHAAPLFDAAGRMAGSCGAARDVTERARVEAELTVAARLAAVGTLSASIAHELNNPLTSALLGISRAQEIMKSSPFDPRLPDLLAEARDGAERMRTILRDLMDLGRPRGSASRVDVRRALEVALRLAGPALRERAALVHEHGEAPAVRGEEARLVQVLLNLLINAAQAIPLERSGTVRTRVFTDPEGRAVVVVQDDGVGIDRAHLPHLFEPFFSTKPRGVGTGLGLYVCKRLLEELGGEISFESEPSKGTTVRVVLAPAMV